MNNGNNFGVTDMKISGKKNVYLNGKATKPNKVIAFENISKGLAKQAEEMNNK